MLTMNFARTQIFHETNVKHYWTTTKCSKIAAQSYNNRVNKKQFLLNWAFFKIILMGSFIRII